MYVGRRQAANHEYAPKECRKYKYTTAQKWNRYS